MEIVRKHFHIDGQVQGVGFRYRAEHGAASLGLTGWVRNLEDGSVEMEIQGPEDRITRLLILIGRGMFVRMENVRERTLPTDPCERGFAAY
jgi:acylphosphatase